MMAALWQIVATAAALTLLLPFAIRFDLKVLGQLPLRGPERRSPLWPVRTWTRALRKRTRHSRSGGWIAALVGGVLLVTAATIISCGWTVLAWAMAVCGVGRAILAIHVASGSAPSATRREVLAEGFLSTTVWSMSLVGPAALVALGETRAMVGHGWLLIQQPAAALGLGLAVVGSWVDAIAGNATAIPAVTFHRFHANAQSAWLITDAYVWRLCGLAAWTVAFLPSVTWITRLVVVVAGLLVVLWMRRIYVTDLRGRLGWRFWPSLALLTGASAAVTVWLVASTTG